jgi:GxxExxY protein
VDSFHHKRYYPPALTLTRTSKEQTTNKQLKGSLMKYFEPLSPEVEQVATATVDAAYKIHRTLGPGLIESVYERCLIYELRKLDYEVRNQFWVSIKYDELVIEAAFRPDILVAETLLVEVKSVEQMHPVCRAQLTTYLKLMEKPLGLLINFNVPLIKQGIKRVILSKS